MVTRSVWEDSQKDCLLLSVQGAVGAMTDQFGGGGRSPGGLCFIAGIQMSGTRLEGTEPGTGEDIQGGMLRRGKLCGISDRDCNACSEPVQVRSAVRNWKLIDRF